METTTICLLLVCIIALAIVHMAFNLGTKETQKETEEPKIYDFTVQFYVTRGWYGTADDNGTAKYTYLKLPGDAPLKERDTLRVKMTGYAKGNYEAEPIYLNELPEETIVPTYKDKNGIWHCMFQGVQGLAFVGYILKHPLMETPSFKEGKPYRAVRHEKNNFSLA